MQKRGDKSQRWSFIDESIKEINRRTTEGTKGTKDPRAKDKKPDSTDNLIEAEPSNPLKFIP